ncbi:sensor histidine kinase [Luteibacter sahnii]|uniref:sensor histidine kinase n=1 Tax=Luteibacter sahnii TaxID=3021977 RepID=UPI002A6AEF16|nr:sensor histidine kinase [Luteibacter sp. PPL193]MDY1548067.1 sensor histidine kinase [Luteibacter sp. PPL193]
MALPVPRKDSLLGSLHSPAYLRWQAALQVLWLFALIQAPWAVNGFHWRWFLPTVLSIVIYLVCYAQAFLGSMKRLPFHALAIVATGFALWPVNGVALGLVAIGLALLAFAARPGLWLGATAAAAILTLAWSVAFGIPAWHAAVVALTGLAGGMSNFLYVRSARRDLELRLSQVEVRRLATLAERERIGRDLHDLLGHTLSLITLKSELARRLATADPARAQREMEEVERVARHTLGEVRSAVTGLRAGDLASELVAARVMLEASGIALDTSMPDALRLPESVQASLALVLREAITNIHRHSQASAARVDIIRTGKEFSMRISDNGRGGLAAHGNGVSGMRERVRQVGGSLAIDSPAKQGTTLTIALTLSPALTESVA